MSQILLSPRALIGLVSASPTIDQIPPGTWAMEEALAVALEEAVALRADPVADSLNAWVRTDALGVRRFPRLGREVRRLVRDGDLMPAGQGMSATYLPDPAWKAGYRALGAALGEASEAAADRGGQRLRYLARLSVMSSNTVRS